ncbi:MAG: hypothetical protein M1827_004167 [Pycnora praestabilis]|nr:MAG: hypothetical protein M1827_004167 [Pycnora praestabilis]
MSRFHATSSSHYQSTAASQYDHQISLVDSTKPRTLDPPSSSKASRDGSFASTVPRSTGGSDAGIGRKWSLREELGRRKYSKWQESRVSEEAEAHQSNEGVRGGTNLEDTERHNVEGEDDGRPSGEEGLGRMEASSTNVTSHGKEEQTEIDVLYENQRGSFLCGIPLYSHKSLLNFDPSAWVTAALKSSPVDITNAQLPDPTWEWLWKSWYVDMSADVDEEGWQYSFSFNPTFSWHGAHVWFHSFVRRRRWLRKRVKVYSAHAHGTNAGDKQFKAGHILNADYFTIHPNMTQSRGSSIGTGTNARSSYASIPGNGDGQDGEIEDVRDINSLMKALRRARIDREKIDVLKTFLDQGGEEILYLADQMSDIMSSFIFQNSRRQLLAHFLHTFNTASKHRDEHVEKGEPEDDAEKRRTDNLLNTVKSADDQVKRLEYWSDVRDMAQKGESKGGADHS